MSYLMKIPHGIGRNETLKKILLPQSLCPKCQPLKKKTEEDSTPPSSPTSSSSSSSSSSSLPSSTPKKMKSLSDIYERCNCLVVELGNFEEAIKEKCWRKAMEEEIDVI